MSPSFSSALLVAAVAVSIYSVNATPLSTPPNAPRTGSQRFAPAPLHTPVTQEHNILNNSYIVMLNPETSAASFSSHFAFLNFVASRSRTQQSNFEDSLEHIWDAGDVGVVGYSGKFSEDFVEHIRRMPEVEYVEKNQMVYALDTQKNAPWGLARVSHRPKLSLGTFKNYEHDPSGGEGVNVYVIDTGIYIDHVEFEGRARWGKTIPKNDQDIDGNGHGTHCAGTIASAKYGVSKSANVTAVKVLGTNGSGTMEDVVAGVVWAATDAKRLATEALNEFRRTGKTKYKGSVANMSLGGGKSKALDDAVNAAVRTGLHFAVAAGNDNRDACNYSPAAATEAVTVGASTVTDERAYFSNHGKCVDIFAPGLNIASTWNTGPESSNTISGTSMASPHTAGMLAYLLSIYPSIHFNPSVSGSMVPAELKASTLPHVSTFSSTYAFCHRFMPTWIQSFIPSPLLLSALSGESDLFEVVLGEAAFAPIPEPTFPILSPVVLKKALIALSTKGVLVAKTLPEGTPNLLIFNNMTDSRGKKWSVENQFEGLWM